MCGFAGMLVRDALSPDDIAEVSALGALAARRGPDDRGEWNDGRSCALAFRRLSIVDLSPAGHQPMVSADEAHALVFNGEIYNFRELRQELERTGRQFRSSSDSEVVLQALAEWGTDAFACFNGMFAIGWYTVASRRLVLARDPIGIKPLCWWRSPEAFVFGSQYDQVVRHRRCNRSSVDPAMLEMYLRLGYLPAPYGVMSDTGQVEPGYFVEIEPGGSPRAHAFHRPFTAAAPGDRLAGAAAADAVSELVGACVGRQTVADVTVGAFLSGGVDSPLVTACMQAAESSPVPAFTIGTDDAESDESAPASTFAGLLGVEHHLRQIKGADAIDLLGDVACANTEPFGDYSSFPTMLVSRLASEHVKVVLSGDGGDELFWGYPRFAKVRRARPWFTLPQSARVAAYAVSKPLPTERRPARGIMFPSIGDWYLDAHSGLRRHDLAAVAPALPGLPSGFDLFEFGGRQTDDAVMQWMRTNELACHLPMILQKVDRAAMFHSLEVRVPLLDLEMVDLAARIDPSACLSGTVGKQVLRTALARHVPASKIPTPKRGFTVPMRRWLRDDLRPSVEALLLERDPFPTGLFDRRSLRDYCDLHQSGARDQTRGMWNLLALQLWSDHHLRPLSTLVALEDS